MSIFVGKGTVTRRELQTRMPFRYGIATLTRLPHVFVQVPVDVDGVRVVGIAADHLAPKWFTKDPATSTEHDIAEMEQVLHHALALANGMQADTPFALWKSLYDAQAAWGESENLAPLLTNFGVSLVERAIMDAFCQAKGKPFASLLSENAFGIDLGAIHPELVGSKPSDFLPATPLPSVLLRHTVGLSDPLTEGDITDEIRVTDGLPQSLEACIRAYGLRHFKLKVGGSGEADAARLAQTVQVIAETVTSEDWAFSVDGNESFKTLADFRAFWEAALAQPALRLHLDTRLLFVEQPLHRSIALSDEAGAAFASWHNHPPMIIDESDAALDSLPRALSLGYAGTSHKNCKGVFKGIINACLLKWRKAENGTPFILSGEDLSTVGPVSLLQDLAVQAALGIESVERNGHHYFAGLSAFPAHVQGDVLAAHPDLYAASPQGWPTLRVENGRINLATVHASPFGVGFPFDPTAL